MNYAIFALVLFSAGTAGAAGFGDLAVNAASLKNFSPAGTL